VWHISTECMLLTYHHWNMMELQTVVLATGAVAL
jgi:hypothetical protein